MTMNAKQEAFVAAYLKNGGNATGAAREAGYAYPDRQGPRLLGNVGVAAAIARAQSERAERTKVDLDYVMTRLAIEAELPRDEGGSQQGRVAALREIRQQLNIGAGMGDDEAPAMSIHITATPAVGEVRVTRSDG